MFERLEKSFLTIETGEAYQPVRVAYDLLQPNKLQMIFDQLKCVATKNRNDQSWEIFWRDETDEIHFESLESFKKPSNPLRLGTFIIKNDTLYLNLPSFKRACLLIPLLHQLIDSSVIKINKADFINKVFGLNERLPHGLTEIYDDTELDNIIRQRIHDYHEVEGRCEHAATAEEAFKILSEYTQTESHKRLPFAERFLFQEIEGSEMDDTYLGFYIFLRSRELVAIRRWFGETGYTLGDAADETVEQVFGGMNIDIIE
jgi:hypothetical protein